MNVLLLISALLSALSGLTGTGRGVERQAAVVCPCSGAAARPVAAVAIARQPVAVTVPVASIASPISATTWVLPALAAPWTLRRRE